MLVPISICRIVVRGKAKESIKPSSLERSYTAVSLWHVDILLSRAISAFVLLTLLYIEPTCYRL